MNGPPAQRLSPRAPPRPPLRWLLLTIGALLLALLVLELGARALRGTATLLDWRNIILSERIETRRQSADRVVADRQLGFAGAPFYQKADVNYDSQGFRIVPDPDGQPSAAAPLLVLGDSLAHGDEVSDAETWPSRLQFRLRRRVLNAAVTGYGLDQSVLRAELLAAEIKPAAIVLSFTADGARRTEMKRVWGAEKPYFERIDGKLVLRNSPVPASPPPADTLDIWQWAFGWSVLVDTVLRHYGWQYEWSMDHARVLPRGESGPLSCALLQRLAGIGLPTLVVAEYHRYDFENAPYGAKTHATARTLLACASDAGLPTLDTFDLLAAAIRQRGIDEVFRLSHPTPEGERIVATAIAFALGQRRLLPQ